MKYLIYGIVVCVMALIVLRRLEHKTLFYPVKALAVTPEDVGLAYEDVQMQTSDQVNLHGWYVPNLQAEATLLFFHGNAGNIADRVMKILYFHRLGLNVLIVDYRGYGRSGGSPSEKGLYLDAVTAYDYLLAREGGNPQKIIVYGASLGGAVAVDLVAQRSVAAVILDSTFSNAADMARRIFPWIPSFLVGVKLDSTAKIKRVTAPTLFIHSPEDNIVPFQYGRKLFDAASEPKEFLSVQGGHNEGEIFSLDPVGGKIDQYLKSQGILSSE